MSLFTPATALATLIALAAPAAAQQAMADKSLAPGLWRIAENEVVAWGATGALTQSAAEAYLDALEFILQQLGEPTRFNADQRAQWRLLITRGYPALSATEQTELARFEEIWSETRPLWPVLPDEDRRQIAYGVLALAFGENLAAEALGLQAPSAPGAQEGTGTKRIGRDDYAGTTGTLPDGCRYITTPIYSERIC